MKRIRFKQWDCIIEGAEYVNGQKALILYDAEDHSVIAKASVCLDMMIPDDHILIKDYGENKGMLECLVSANIVEELEIRHKTGFVEVHECRLLW